MRLLLIILFIPFCAFTQKAQSITNLIDYKVSYIDYPKAVKDLYKAQYKVINIQVNDKNIGDTIKQNLTIYYTDCTTCIAVDLPVDFEKMFLNKQVALVYTKDKITLIKLK